MKNKKELIVFFVVVIVLVAILAFFEAISEETEEEEVIINPPLVVTQPVVRDDFAVYYTTEGKVDNGSYSIGAEIVAGRVSAVFVAVGDYVDEGAPLVSIDTTSSVSQLELQVVSLDQNIADLNLSLEQLQTKRNEVAELVAIGVASDSELREIDNSIESLTVKQNGLLNNRYALTNQIYAIDSVATIYAKEAGTVTKVKFKANQYPTRGDVIEIKTGEKPQATIYLTEKIVKDIAVGDEVEVFIDEEQYVGRVKEVYSLSYNETLYPVEIEFDSDKEYLTGMSVTVKIPVYQKKKAVLVNRQAVIQFHDEVYLYRVADGKAVRTDIEIGHTVDGMTEVLKGLDVGDVVVVEGQFRVNDGEPVEVLSE